MSDAAQKIGRNVKEARERAMLTQEQLATAVGWKSHQTVSQLESGARDVKAWELTKIATVLCVNVSTLLSADEGATSTRPFIFWRKRPENDGGRAEQAFLTKCGEYRFIERLIQATDDKRTGSPLPITKITASTLSYAHVYDLAEALRKGLGLGQCPARSLVRALEDVHCVRFVVSTCDDSAACTKFDDECFILLNGDEPPQRQVFSVAHELFHLITWDKKLFADVEKSADLHTLYESLADAFAAGLLMPSEELLRDFRSCVNDDRIGFADLIALARKYEVSIAALLWRLKYLHALSEKTVKGALSNSDLKRMDQMSRQANESWSDRTDVREHFVRIAFLAYQRGRLSRSRFAGLLEVPLVDLPVFLQRFGYAEVENREISVANS